MRLRDRFQLTTLLALVVSWLIPASALAQVSIKTPDSVKNFSSLAVIIPRIFDIAVGIAGILFVVLLLLGGVQYLVSLGEEEAVTKARKLMINASIGLVIVLSAWGVGNYVLQILGIRISLTGGTAPGAQTSVGGGRSASAGTSPATALAGYNEALSTKQQAFNKYQDISNNPLATQSQIQAAQAELTNRIGGLEQARGLLGQFGVDPAGGSLSQAELATLDAAQTALGNAEKDYAAIHSEYSDALAAWQNEATPENTSRLQTLWDQEQSAQNDLYQADYEAANAEQDLWGTKQSIAVADTPAIDQEVITWDDNPADYSGGFQASAVTNYATQDFIDWGAGSAGNSGAGDAGSSASDIAAPFEF